MVYLRLSVTDRCDLHCRYCRPLSRAPEPQGRLGCQEILDLLALVDQAAGISKVRVTGGEPLLWPDLLPFLAQARRLLPQSELCLTTNGTHLAPLAKPLRQAGVQALNVSLDTLDPDAFARLTRGGSLEQVLHGLSQAIGAGFRRLRMNAVLLRTINGHSLADLVRAAAGWGVEPRFIELMPFGEGAGLFDQEFLGAPEALRRLRRALEYQGPLALEGTARRHLFRVGGHVVPVGFISPLSHPFCASCNRLRLDGRGRLLSCLRQGQGMELGDLLRQGRGEEIRARVREALLAKGPGQAWPQGPMSAIGG